MSSVRNQAQAASVIARTKLAVPVPRARIVSRPGLVEALEAGRSGRLTLVCASTGWGKSSLLAEWATAVTTPFAWVSLEKVDDVPLRFWRCVVAGMSVAAPAAVATARRRLEAPVVAIADEVLPVLVNGLADAGEPLVVVLDDYHVISDPEIHAQLEMLLERLPSGVHFVLAAQADPPLHLGRMRALGDLAELRCEQLRFTDGEAAELLNRVHGLDLEAHEVQALQRRIEGWVGGLNLAALSLRRDAERERIVQALPGDDRFLVDYLWGEVVLAQPPAVRQFLVRTAILERLTGPLCDAVAEWSDSAGLLRELEAANLFIVPLDREHEWFRYHHLFRSLLLGQLERFAPELISDLHRRASSWFDGHGLMAEAIEHAMAAGDMHYAADELAHHWRTLYADGQTLSLMAWIERLPADAIAAHPTLAVVRAGLSRVVGRSEDIEPWLERIEPDAAEMPAHGLASSVAGACALIRSMHRLAGGDVTGAIDSARRGFELERMDGSQEQATAGYFLGVATFFRQPQQARPLLERFLEVVGDEQDPRHRYVMALLAELFAFEGEIDTAQQLADNANGLTRRLGQEEHPPTNQVHIAVGAVALARGDHETAEDQIERAVTLAKRGRDRVEIAHTLLWLARVRACHGDLDGGRKALRQARELVPDLGLEAMPELVQAVESELANQTPTPVTVSEGEKLTESELRVLRLMPSDLSYRDMAGQLYVSLNTVRTHALHLRRKLGASARAEVVARARQRGLL